MKLTRQLLERTAWFVDYDGSVCPHQEVWEERVYNPVDIHALLKRLRAKSGSLCWNSGRRPESLAGVLGDFLEFDGYFIHGSCAWKAAPEGSLAGIKEIIGSPVPDFLLRMATDFFERKKIFQLEVKPTSLRFTPARGQPMHDLDRELAVLRPQTPPEWRWIVGPRGAELLHKNFDKGLAVRREMAKTPNLIPIAIGDDVFDRFAVEEVLKRGGFAILVGEHCGWITEVPHVGEQILYFEKPQGVLDLLASLAD